MDAFHKQPVFVDERIACVPTSLFNTRIGKYTQTLFP